MSKAVACPSCGFKNPDSAKRCASCGASVDAPRSLRSSDVPPSKRYQQSGFSLMWLGVSLAVLVVLTGAIVVGLPMFVKALDFEGRYGMLVSIPVWFLGGLLVGMVSPGKTFAEPTVAALFVSIPTVAWLIKTQTVRTMDSFMYVIMAAIGIMFTMVGSYLGERIQIGSPAEDRRVSLLLAARLLGGRILAGRLLVARVLVARALAGSLLAGPLVAGGCGDDGRERQHVLARIDALRDGTGAPIDDRRRLLEALRSAPGDEPVVAQARDRCAAAYADLVEANAIEENARAAMATGERVDTILLAKQLEQATRLLESSRGAMPACDRAATDLRAAR